MANNWQSVNRNVLYMHASRGDKCEVICFAPSIPPEALLTLYNTCFVEVAARGLPDSFGCRMSMTCLLCESA
eukprot:scaffold679762_cov62-Prasinocladus_malaysianus.AAC.1